MELNLEKEWERSFRFGDRELTDDLDQNGYQIAVGRGMTEGEEVETVRIGNS